MENTVGHFFAIRVKDSARFLPQGNGSGFTYSEPVAGPQPRLFASHKAAHLALTAWLKGHASNRTSIDWETGYQEIGNLTYSPVEGRLKENMEIVRVRLELDPA
jgi:hypothetical protein